MSPKLFLQIGGAIFLVLGLIGFIAPTLFGDLIVLSDTQNIVHVVLGIGALILGSIEWAGVEKRWTALALALIALFYGIMGFIWSENPFNVTGLTDFEDPVDNVLYILIAIWGFATLFVQDQGFLARRAK